MWRMGVPVATPVSGADLLAALAALLRPAGGVLPELERDVQALFHGLPVRFVDSGRAALYLVLQAMKQAPARDEVVVPAFVCPSVGRAVIKAGLKPVLCDVSDSSFTLDPADLERVAGRRTLAIVATHLFGYPADLVDVLRLARAAGALVIEDAAQAFGARLGGVAVGTSGDAGIFSLVWPPFCRRFKGAE
jgi:dTDP-4-amino-4,6-dideoxygalactose transaminase